MALKTIVADKLGFEDVITTASLDEAVEQLSKRPDVSLGLFDLAMPGMETAASLRAVRECFEHVQVVVVSGSKRREDIILSLEAGVHGYITKGSGSTELVRALEMVLDGHLYVPPFLATLPPGPPEQEAAIRAALSEDLTSTEMLTPRQREVIALLAEGKSNKEIARALKLSDATVKVHVAAIFRTVGVTSRSAAAVVGFMLGAERAP